MWNKKPPKKSPPSKPIAKPIKPVVPPSQIPDPSSALSLEVPSYGKIQGVSNTNLMEDVATNPTYAQSTFIMTDLAISPKLDQAVHSVATELDLIEPVKAAQAAEPTSIFSPSNKVPKGAKPCICGRHEREESRYWQAKLYGMILFLG